MAYTITFDTGGGSSVAPLTEQTALPNPLPTPTKSGYTFLGWYYDSTFTTKAQANDVLTANVTLYAKWYNLYEPKIFEVGDVLPQRRITIYRDSSTDSPNISIKSDSDTFNFIYYSSPSWYYINGERTFFKLTTPSSTIVNLSSLSVEKRTISSVSDNIFSWEDTFVNYKNLEKTDIFPPSIIRFRLFGDSYFTTNGYELYTDGGSFTLATGGEDEDTYINGVKLNYNSFVDVDMRNWSLSKRTIAYSNYLGPESDSIGQWSSFSWEELPPSYTITFEENGGSTVTDLTDQTALPNPLPIPTKSGYTFVGWYYDSNFTTQAQASDTLSANVTLYAKWEQVTSGPKIFEVGDVLPATTQLRISWDYDTVIDTNSAYIKTSNLEVGSAPFYMSVNASVGVYSTSIRWDGIYRELDNKGKTGSIIINTSSSSSDSDRTVTAVFTEGVIVTWEDLNASTGYSITFEENGGTTVTDLTDQTNLPSPLPTTTKANHVFAGWYYDNLFTQKANAGDELEGNVSLYAKWYTPTTWCEDIADAIREKDGTTEPIKHLDFPDKIKNIQGAKPEETKTVTPDFSSGNQIILPTTNKVLSQVTLTKPTDLIPENIAKDKNVCGVVGTLESGGGSSANTLTMTLDKDEGIFSGELWVKDGNGNYVLNLGDGLEIRESGIVVLSISTDTFTFGVSGGSAGRQITGITGLVAEGSNGYRFTSNIATITFRTLGCLLKGTKITLSDYSAKNIEDVTYSDELLVWDFDNGMFSSEKPLWIQKKKKVLQYNRLIFSDGSTLDTVNQHRIFNAESGRFTYPMTEDTPIGTTTFNHKGEFITLVDKYVIEEEVEYYNIITNYHINLFANSILTSCRLSNLYPIENMTYQKDDRELHDSSLFSELDDKWIKGLRLLEQPLEINRDNAVVFENSLVEYVKRLERSMKDDK